MMTYSKLYNYKFTPVYAIIVFGYFKIMYDKLNNSTYIKSKHNH